MSDGWIGPQSAEGTNWVDLEPSYLFSGYDLTPITKLSHALQGETKESELSLVPFLGPSKPCGPDPEGWYDSSDAPPEADVFFPVEQPQLHKRLASLSSSLLRETYQSHTPFDALFHRRLAVLRRVYLTVLAAAEQLQADLHAKRTGLNFVQVSPDLLRRQLNYVPKVPHNTAPPGKAPSSLLTVNPSGCPDPVLMGYHRPYGPPDWNRSPTSTLALGLAPLSALGFGLETFLELLALGCAGSVALSERALQSFEELFEALPLFAFSERYSEVAPPLSFPFALPYPVPGIGGSALSLLPHLKSFLLDLWQKFQVNKMHTSAERVLMLLTYLAVRRGLLRDILEVVCLLTGSSVAETGYNSMQKYQLKCGLLLGQLQEVQPIPLLSLPYFLPHADGLRLPDYKAGAEFSSTRVPQPCCVAAAGRHVYVATPLHGLVKVAAVGRLAIVHSNPDFKAQLRGQSCASLCWCASLGLLAFTASGLLARDGGKGGVATLLLVQPDTLAVAHRLLLDLGPIATAHTGSSTTSPDGAAPRDAILQCKVTSDGTDVFLICTHQPQRGVPAPAGRRGFVSLSLIDLSEALTRLPLTPSTSAVVPIVRRTVVLAIPRLPRPGYVPRRQGIHFYKDHTIELSAYAAQIRRLAAPSASTAAAATAPATMPPGGPRTAPAPTNPPSAHGGPPRRSSLSQQPPPPLARSAFPPDQRSPVGPPDVPPSPPAQ
eukprot:EG_transcript_4873